MKSKKRQLQLKYNGKLSDFESYQNITLWIDFWFQYEFIKSTNPKSILEIGKGTGTLEYMFESSRYNFTTLDIDERLHPDKVGDIVDIPFRDNSFDTICAFQVLEHIPYSEVHRALSEMKRVTRNYIVISLPYSCFYFSVSFQFFYTVFIDPIFKFFKLKPSTPFYFNITFPTFFIDKYRMNINHEWELGRKNYPLRRIRKLFESLNLELLKEESRMLYPYHRYFILKKKS